MSAGFKILGIPQLDARLGMLAVELTAGQAVEAALLAAALPVQNAWKQKAPYKTGSYRRSIHTVIDNTKPAAIIGTDITSPPYPEYLEFGTSKMDARPSMRPAFDENKDAAVEAFAAAIKKALYKYGAV